jgi:hypothetical protein
LEKERRSTVNALKKWLKRNGFEYREVITTEGNAGVMISTNYTGEHPKKETFDTIASIEKKCKTLHLKSEQRGYYTAVLVTS